MLCAIGDPSKTIIYVGRVKTSNFEKRMDYHESRNRQLVRRLSNLTYAECRGLEQYYMLYYHTIARGAIGYNQIRGISPTNSRGVQYYLAALNYLSNQYENERLNALGY